MDITFSGPILIETLLLSKALEPLSATAKDELERIQNLDVSGFSEAEVRAYVLDPIVRILGYAKGSIFSVDLEKKIDFLNKNKFIDYKLTLWKENFWLIEAKKPNTNVAFAYDDLAQAVEYAVHPDVNAALVVLCDGQKLEIFDREVSLTAPVLHVDRQNLIVDFDKVRLLLEPWQIWFFQKRRIVRLLDKVFDKEFNLSRADEFKSLVQHRLDSKRSIILDNFRAQIKSEDAWEEAESHLRTTDDIELIDIHFFLRHSTRTIPVIINALVERSERRAFQVLYRMFPDHPRDMNDMFCMHALGFLMALEQKSISVQWLPTWLAGSERELGTAIRRLIALCLTSFAADESRKVILLSATAFRRIFKVLSISSEDQWRAGQIFHAIERYVAPELSWGQIVASPSHQVIQKLDNATLLATLEFVKRCRDDHGRFLTQSGKSKLAELWRMERALLASVPEYNRLRDERQLGECHPTEASNVAYDNLGHSCLCALKQFPAWKAYALSHHRLNIEAIAALGSWQAKEWLGLEATTELARPDDATIAARFFFGDVKILSALKAGYNFK